MVYDTVIANGRLLTATRFGKGDLGISGNRIARVGKISAKSRHLAKRVIDASDCYVLPGAIDPHVHLALEIGKGIKTSDGFDSGTLAAACGGITTCLDYTAPHPGEAPLEAFFRRKGQAQSKAIIDFGFHNVLIAWNPSWQKELKQLALLGAPSVKLFMIYGDRGWKADDSMLMDVMQNCQQLDVLVCVHAENDGLIGWYQQQLEQGCIKTKGNAFALAQARPPLVEEEAVARVVRLAEALKTSLHLVHLSTQEAARIVGQSSQRGSFVSGETCPQYLVLDHSRLQGSHGHLWGCCPPLRHKNEQAGLWQALKRGWLNIISTDHCAFDLAQKNRWQGNYRKIPYGLPGVETSLSLTYTYGPMKGRLSLRQWVQMHTEYPAKRFGLFPKKGNLDVGADADVVVWDPFVKRQIKASQLSTNCDWNPYEGRTLWGMARQVFLRGNQIVQDEQPQAQTAHGEFVVRKGPLKSLGTGW